jgi:peptidoglycan/xylan/chitin deacetylase (PgdA/CDA1 family)
MNTEYEARRNSNLAAAALEANWGTLPGSAEKKHAAIGAHHTARRATLNLVAGSLWYAPGSFAMARFLGPRYSLRCMLFHDISDTDSPFTKGLGVTVTRKHFEAALKFITRHYTPVSLQDVIADSDGRGLPPRPLLVTFDDAYASVSEFAAPLCSKFGVPAVFFVNGACLDNRQLALDNLVCYVANVLGMSTINAAAHVAVGTKDSELRSLPEVFARFFPTISLSAREVFRGALLDSARINERDLAAEARLYLTSHQLRDLATFNFELGNHTYTHTNCRCLSAGDFALEIERNKAVLEAISGTKVRSFSVPYGSSADLTGDLVAHLHGSGCDAVFLSESRANPPCPDRFRLDRVSIRTGSNSTLFSEIEILPRLRTIRNSLFGTATVQPSCSVTDLENRRQTSWPRTSDDGAGIGDEARRANPGT